MTFPVVGITGRADQSVRPPNVFLFAVAQAYVRAIELAAGTPLVIPPHLDRAPLRTAFERIDGLILSGGGDIRPRSYGEEESGVLSLVDDERDRAELALARWALADQLPLLAICRGAQVLNVAAGGTLIQDIATDVPGALSHSSVGDHPAPVVGHTAHVAAGSRLAALVGAGELGVNSAHHQAVKVVGRGLVVSARAPDGIIEGLEAPGQPFCVGVQWHPEVMGDSHPVMRSLFEGLTDVARSRSRRCSERAG